MIALGALLFNNYLILFRLDHVTFVIHTAKYLNFFLVY